MEDRWIPVTERLPLTCQDVDISVIAGGIAGPHPFRVTNACYRLTEDGEVRWSVRGGLIDIEEPVTHWMPIPPPPES